MTDAELVEKLKALPQLRMTVETLDSALAQLTPEERLVAQLLLLHPKKNNVRLLCQRLEIEMATAYRRRRQVLDKLHTALLKSGN